MGLKNEEARGRRRQKQKELLSCVSITSEEQVKESYGPPKLSLENNFGWQVVEKTQVGDGFFPHFTGFYEKPDLSGKEFQKVTYVLYMNKGAVVKEDRIVEEAEPVEPVASKVESVRTEPSKKSTKIVEEEPPAEVPMQKPRRHRGKLIEEFYYTDLKSRVQSRSQSPASVKGDKKPKPSKAPPDSDKYQGKKHDTSSGQHLGTKGFSHGEPDKRESRKPGKSSDRGGSVKPQRHKSRHKSMGFDRGESIDERHGSASSKRRKSSHKAMGFDRAESFEETHRRDTHSRTRSMDSIHRQPSHLPKGVSFDRDLNDAKRDISAEHQNQTEIVKDAKQQKLDEKQQRIEEKRRQTVEKARERIKKRNLKLEHWRAGASNVSVANEDEPEKRDLSLRRKKDKGIFPLASNQSDLIENFVVLSKKSKKPSESLLETPTGSNQYLYVPVRRNPSSRKKVVQ